MSREQSTSVTTRRSVLATAATVSLSGCTILDRTQSATFGEPTTRTNAATATEPASTTQATAQSGHQPADVHHDATYDGTFHDTDGVHVCRLTVTVTEWHDDDLLLHEGRAYREDYRHVDTVHRHGAPSGEDRERSDIGYYADGQQIWIATVDPATETVTTQLSGTIRINADAETCEVIPDGE